MSRANQIKPVTLICQRCEQRFPDGVTPPEGSSKPVYSWIRSDIDGDCYGFDCGDCMPTIIRVREQVKQIETKAVDDVKALWDTAFAERLADASAEHKEQT